MQLQAAPLDLSGSISLTHCWKSALSSRLSGKTRLESCSSWRLHKDNIHNTNPPRPLKKKKLYNFIFFMFYELDVHTNHSVVIIQEMSLLFFPSSPLALSGSSNKWNRTDLISKVAAWKHRKHGRQVRSRFACCHGGFVSSCFACAEQQSVCVLWQTSARTWFIPKSFKLAGSKWMDFHFSPALRVTGRGFLLEPIPAAKGQRQGQALDMTTLDCSTIKIGKDKQASFPVVLYVDERLF